MRGYDGILTLDVNQLSDPTEWRALRRCGLHHVSLHQGRTVRGVKGLARVIASVVVAMPYVLDDLAAVDSQRIVELSLFASGLHVGVAHPLLNRRISALAIILVPNVWRRS